MQHTALYQHLLTRNRPGQQLPAEIYNCKNTYT